MLPGAFLSTDEWGLRRLNSDQMTCIEGLAGEGNDKSAATWQL